MDIETNPKPRSPKKVKTQFHSRIAKGNNIHENLEKQEKKSSLSSKKITPAKFIIFFLSHFSLIYSIQARLQTRRTCPKRQRKSLQENLFLRL